MSNDQNIMFDHYQIYYESKKTEIANTLLN